jgi:hypothetical protein
MGEVHFYTPESLAEYALRRLVVRAHVSNTEPANVKILLACCKDNEMEVVVWEGNPHMRIERFPLIEGGEACLKILEEFCPKRCAPCSEMLRYRVETTVVKHLIWSPEAKVRESGSAALYLLPVYGQIQERLRINRWCSSQAKDSGLSLLQTRFDAFVRSCVRGAREELSDVLG